MNVTKLQLTKRIASETDMTQLEVKEIVQKLFDYMADALAEGHKLEFRRFGVLSLMVAKKTVGRNPKKPENVVVIPEHVKVKFKSCKELADRVKKLDSNDFK